MTFEVILWQNEGSSIFCPDVILLSDLFDKLDFLNKSSFVGNPSYGIRKGTCFDQPAGMHRLAIISTVRI